MDCPICYENVEALSTGCTQMSCGHKFHPTCLMKWFTKSSGSTCPMCRHEAGPLERLPEEEEDEEEEDEEEDDDDDDDDEEERVIVIARESLHNMLVGFGASGVNAGMRDMFDEDDEVVLDRNEFTMLCIAQGGRSPSDVEWEPVATTFAPRPAVPTLQEVGLESFAEHAAEMAISRAWQEAVAINDGQVVLSRGAIESLLHRQGSAATVSEFLNEDLEDEEDLIESITMTQASLNARLTSLGAEPVSSGFFHDFRLSQQPSAPVASILADLAYQEPSPADMLVVSVGETGERSVTAKPRIVLNPEEDAELGPA
jgi:hypothetical protein